MNIVIDVTYLTIILIEFIIICLLGAYVVVLENKLLNKEQELEHQEQKKWIVAK